MSLEKYEDNLHSSDPSFFKGVCGGRGVASFNYCPQTGRESEKIKKRVEV